MYIATDIPDSSEWRREWKEENNTEDMCIEDEEGKNNYLPSDKGGNTHFFQQQKISGNQTILVLICGFT